MSSRLFTEIRENRGLAYDIHSYVDHFHNSGSFTIYAGVDPKKVETAVAAILEEMSKLKQGITPEELARAKELSKGRLQLQLENSQSMALGLSSREILRQQILSVDDVTSIIDAITAEDVERVAKELLNTEQLSLAIVGPAKEEEALLELLRI